jgi:hypothetical protein
MFLRLKEAILAAVFITAMLVVDVNAQNVKRVVILKIDGLPGYYLDSVVKRRDAKTGKSILPWVEEVFYKNGTRVPNFYTRGMSLSGPSWGQLDTGQYAQIKGNVEFDRYTLHSYDYLNFLPYYLDYGKSKKVDMPATEVMDQLKIPLLCDAFPAERRYTAQQLYQRGYDWSVLASGFVNMIPRDTGDLIDEWTIGLNFRKMTVDQVQRDIEGKLIKRRDIDYFDYYDTSIDHVSHHNNDFESRLVPLRELDRTIGRIWSAIQRSSRADETALVLISDHGFNSDAKVYSQGFNLVKLLAERAGGGHHVITKRRLLLDYSLKGLNPLVPLIRTSSHESFYLKGQSGIYPTAVIDFDGNERSSVYLRHSDLNIIHILMQQLQGGLVNNEAEQRAAADALISTIDKHRERWQTTVNDLNEELDALQRWIGSEQKKINGLQMKPGDGVSRLDAEHNRRQREQVALAIESVTAYRQYIQTLENLLTLNRDILLSRKFKIDDYVAHDAIGDANSIYDLQNYVIGLSEKGIVTDGNGKLDFAKSFQRLNYFEFLRKQRVRNNVQEAIGNRPVDFVAAKIPLEQIRDNLPKELQPTEDAIWLYGGSDRQTLILVKRHKGEAYYRYLPIANLARTAGDKLYFETREWSGGFPLKYIEDENLNVSGDRTAWLNSWHSEIEWLRAVHKTTYSNAIIGLNEQLKKHPLIAADDESADETLIRRFRQRQRQLAEADLLVVASDHWNFDVRGFNPGGNHGSFLRVSTNSTFMIAGGEKTGIPRAFMVSEPYDSLSFVPTILRLMGKIDADGELTPELKSRGFHKFPGRVISEITAK